MPAAEITITDWIQAGSALFTFLVTLALCFVAYRQWKTYNRQADIMEKQASLASKQTEIAELTRKQAYFSHYLDIYDGIVNVVQFVQREGKVDDEHFGIAVVTRNKATLLAEENICELTEKLVNYCRELRCKQDELSCYNDHTDEKRHCFLAIQRLKSEICGFSCIEEFKAYFQPDLIQDYDLAAV